MKNIGIIVPTVDNSFFSNLCSCIEKQLYSYGYKAFICDSSNQAEKEKMYIKSLLEKEVEGIICVSGLSNLPEEFTSLSTPIVWVDRIPKSKGQIISVSNDDASAMYEACTYLLEKGCRNIVLMSGYLAEKQESPRVIGYKKALEKYTIPFKDEYVLNRAGKRSSEEESEELLLNLSNQGYKVDGIITSSDRAAFGAITALKKTGYYVPEDVKLISFDNSPYTYMASPSITSIDRNPSTMAKVAVDILLKCINKEEVESHTNIPVSIVKRDSTR